MNEERDRSTILESGNFGGNMPGFFVPSGHPPGTTFHSASGSGRHIPDNGFPMQVLESKETPGLGDKILHDRDFLANFESLDVSLKSDGSGLELLYGSESHATGTNGEIIQFTQARELENGRIMALIRPFTDTEGGGELIAVVHLYCLLALFNSFRAAIGQLDGNADVVAT